MKTVPYDQQVKILAAHITKQAVTDKYIYSLYTNLVASNNKGREERLIAFAFSHPRLIPALDAGLVFIRPTSELRRRCYILFSLLEAHPQYADSFLSEKLNFAQTLGVFAYGARAAFRVIAGIVIIKVGRL